MKTSKQPKVFNLSQSLLKIASNTMTYTVQLQQIDKEQWQCWERKADYEMLSTISDTMM